MRIAFATPGAVPLLRDRPCDVYGGSERRAFLFIRGLADRGRTVRVVAFEPDGPDAETVGGVVVVRDAARTPAPRRRSWPGWPGRRASDRVLVDDPPVAVTAADADAWSRCDADVYVAIGPGDYAAGLAAWCRSVGRPMLLMTGHDIDLEAGHRPGNAEANAFGNRADLCHYAITRAAAVVVQSRRQADLLARRFGREGVVIRNPIDMDAAPPPSPPAARRCALWVGKTNMVKRPDLALRLASLCPQTPFRLIVNPCDQGHFAFIRDNRPANVEVVAQVAANAMPGEYAGAFCLVNTSSMEGFPNAFLEAGRQGVPVVSLTVDPDDVITRTGGGRVAGGDLERMAAHLRDLHASPAAAMAAGDALREYVRDHHGAADRIGELDDVLTELAGHGSVD